MNIARSARRLLGALTFFFVGLPLSLGGLSILSIQRWAGDPAQIKTLVADPRFDAAVSSPDLYKLFPEELPLGGAALESKAAVKAAQAAVSPDVLRQTAISAIDRAFAALESGQASFSVDLGPIKAALDAKAPLAASTYLAEANAPSAALPPGALPAGSANLPEPRQAELAREALAAALRAQAQALPDSVPVNLPPDMDPVRVEAIRTGMKASGTWMLICAAAVIAASAFLSENSLRKRLSTLGSRVLLPGSLALILGVLPRLFQPTVFFNAMNVNGLAMSDIPALAEYGRFVMASITGGFLSTGLVATALGAVLSGVGRALPPARTEDEAEDAE